MPSLFRIGTLLTVVLAACFECETATCLAEEAVDEWPDDTEGVTKRVLAMPDDISRAVVVGRLSDTYPGQTKALCAALPLGTSRARCDRVNNRPHLSEAPGSAPTGNGGASGGTPGDHGPPAPGGAPRVATFPEVEIPLPDGAAPEGVCAGEADRSACLDRTALDAALAGDPGQASAICALHTDDRWRDECRFNAAEQLVRTKHGDGYRTAAILCGAADSFTQECWAHVLTRLPHGIPLPTAGKTRVGNAVRAAESVRRAWAPIDAAAAAWHVDRYWALYFANVYRYTRDPDGTPLQTYPAEAWPHVRAAVAMRLREQNAVAGSLDAQVATVAAALARRNEDDPKAARRTEKPDLVFVQGLGVPTVEGPLVHFLGSERRPLGQDEATDLLFCVIESGARAQPPDLTLLEEASRHADPRVAAEAARLRAAIEPG